MSFLVRLPESLYERDAFDGFATNGFSLGTARAAAWLAQLAYEDDVSKIDRVLEHWVLERVMIFNHAVSTPLPLANTRGVMVKGHGALFIIFTGTDPLVVANWITDFRIFPNPQGIHSGFMSALAPAWPGISSEIARVALSSPLYIIGHSLGASLAALLAWQVVRELAIEVHAVYTFGMPRTGTHSFAADFNGVLGGRTYRLVNGEDIVASVPPSTLSFEHVGRLLVCPRGGRFEANLLESRTSDRPKFALDLLESVNRDSSWLILEEMPAVRTPNPLRLLSSLLPPPLGDHLPDRYCQALRPASRE